MMPCFLFTAGGNVLHTSQQDMQLNNTYVYHMIQNSDTIHEAFNLTTALRYASSYAAASENSVLQTVSGSTLSTIAYCTTSISVCSCVFFELSSYIRFLSCHLPSLIIVHVIDAAD